MEATSTANLSQGTNARMKGQPWHTEGVDRRGQPAVHAKDFFLNEGGQRQVVEDLRAVPPHVHAAVLPQALVVEPVDLCDHPRPDDGWSGCVQHDTKKNQSNRHRRHTPGEGVKKRPDVPVDILISRPTIKQKKSDTSDQG